MATATSATGMSTNPPMVETGNSSKVDSNNKTSKGNNIFKSICCCFVSGENDQLLLDDEHSFPPASKNDDQKEMGTDGEKDETKVKESTSSHEEISGKEEHASGIVDISGNLQLQDVPEKDGASIHQDVETEEASGGALKKEEVKMDSAVGIGGGDAAGIDTKASTSVGSTSTVGSSSEGNRRKSSGRTSSTDLFQKAQIYYINQDYDMAVIEFQKVVKYNESKYGRYSEDTKWAYHYLAAFYFLKVKTNDANPHSTDWNSMDTTPEEYYLSTYSMESRITMYLDPTSKGEDISPALWKVLNAAADTKDKSTDLTAATTVLDETLPAITPTKDSDEQEEEDGHRPHQGRNTSTYNAQVAVVTPESNDKVVFSGVVAADDMSFDSASLASASLASSTGGNVNYYANAMYLPSAALSVSTDEGVFGISMDSIIEDEDDQEGQESVEANHGDLAATSKPAKRKKKQKNVTYEDCTRVTRGSIQCERAGDLHRKVGEYEDAIEKYQSVISLEHEFFGTSQNATVSYMFRKITFLSIWKDIFGAIKFQCVTMDVASVASSAASNEIPQLQESKDSSSSGSSFSSSNQSMSSSTASISSTKEKKKRKKKFLKRLTSKIDWNAVDRLHNTGWIQEVLLKYTKKYQRDDVTALLYTVEKGDKFSSQCQYEKASKEYVRAMEIWDTRIGYTFRTIIDQIVDSNRGKHTIIGKDKIHNKYSGTIKKQGKTKEASHGDDESTESSKQLKERMKQLERKVTVLTKIVEFKSKNEEKASAKKQANASNEPAVVESNTNSPCASETEDSGKVQDAPTDSSTSSGKGRKDDAIELVNELEMKMQILQQERDTQMEEQIQNKLSVLQQQFLTEQEKLSSSVFECVNQMDTLLGQRLDRSLSRVQSQIEQVTKRTDHLSVLMEQATKNHIALTNRVKEDQSKISGQLKQTTMNHTTLVNQVKQDQSELVSQLRQLAELTNRMFSLPQLQEQKQEQLHLADKLTASDNKTAEITEPTTPTAASKSLLFSLSNHILEDENAKKKRNWYKYQTFAGILLVSIVWMAVTSPSTESLSTQPMTMALAGAPKGRGRRRFNWLVRHNKSKGEERRDQKMESPSTFWSPGGGKEATDDTNELSKPWKFILTKKLLP